MILARKITRSKWAGAADGPGEPIPADAVTVDLRTSQNTLSFWACDSEEPHALEQAVLALAAGVDRVDKLDLTWLLESQVTNEQLKVKETPGNTPVDGLRSRHRDVAELDYVRLGKVARLIQGSLVNKRFRRFTKKEVLGVLVDAVQEGSVQLEDLKDDVREEVEKKLNQPPK